MPRCRWCRQRRTNPGWYRARAYAALRIGLDAAAAADARKSLAEAGWDADTVYAALVAAIAHRRVNQRAEAAEMLDNARRAANVPEWTLAVIDYLDGRLSAEVIVKKARDVGRRRKPTRMSASWPPRPAGKTRRSCIFDGSGIRAHATTWSTAWRRPS